MKRFTSDNVSNEAGIIRTMRATSPFLLPLILSGCSAAPSQDIFGSFFPSWMLCAGIGVIGAVVCRQIILRVGMEGAIFAPPVTYLAIAIAITLLVWLLRFGG